MVIARKRKYEINLKYATFINLELNESDVLEDSELIPLLKTCNDKTGELVVPYHSGTYKGRTFSSRVESVHFEGNFEDDGNIISRREEYSFNEYVAMGRPKSIPVVDTITFPKDCGQ